MKTYIVFIMILLITSCNPSTVNTPITTDSVPETLANNTEIPIAETIKPSIIVPTTNKLTSCVDHKQGSELSGQIVFYSEGIVFCDVRSGELKHITYTEEVIPFLTLFSPNHDAFLYRTWNGDVGLISSKSSLSAIALPEGIDIFAAQWITSSKLAFNLLSKADGSVKVIDITSGTNYEIVTGLNDINTVDPVPWYGYASTGSVVLSPMLDDRYIYMSLPSSESGKTSWILRDRDTQKVLWMKNTLNVSVQPKWSTSGYLAALVIGNSINSDEVFIIDRDGLLITTISKENLLVNSDILIQNLEWAPNGELIALQILSTQSKKQLLVVYNLTTSHFFQFPLEKQPFRLIWSPDSKYIAINNKILDVENSNAIELHLENASYGPLGWLVTPP